MQVDANLGTTGRRGEQPLSALHIPEALLKIQTVVALTGMSEASIRRRVREGKFPRPTKTGGMRCVRWVAGEVSSWLKASGSTLEQSK